MNRYALWKYIVIGVALLFGVIYTVPNFFGEAPAVQVSSQKATVKVDPATRRAVADQLPAIRDALTIACTDGKWSTQVRNCMVSAGDHLALQACQQHLTDEQRRALDRAQAGETTSH